MAARAKREEAMNKQTKTTERTKSILSDAFWQLYCHEDIRKISVKDITDRAGYNRSTFYQHFIDTYDVLEQIEDSLINDIAENVSKLLTSKNDTSWMKQITAMYDLKSEYLSVLLGRNGDPAFLDKLKTVMRPIYINKIKIDTSDFQANLMLEFTSSGILACIMYWYNQGKPIPAEEIVTMVRSIMKEGVLAAF